MKVEIKLKGVSGIYQIFNTVNNKCYIGRTKCFYRRCHQYKHSFRYSKQNHINAHLMNSMKKYTIDKFEFIVLETCENSMTPDRELYWIKKLKSNDKELGYNIRLDVKGKMVTDQRTRDKISKRLKKEWASGSRAEHSKKLTESWRDRDRNAQSELMSNSLTKYVYDFRYKDTLVVTCKYSQFTEEFRKKGFIKFYYKKTTDTIHYKGFAVTRRLV